MLAPDPEDQIRYDIPDPRSVAEEFVVDGYVRPAVMSVLNDNQHGAIPNSSTTVALISMLHSWSLGTDGNGATVRTLLDYRIAFDLIDHSILVRKLGKVVGSIPTEVKRFFLYLVWFPDSLY